jgi:hypothetical protein
VAATTKRASPPRGSLASAQPPLARIVSGTSRDEAPGDDDGDDADVAAEADTAGTTTPANDDFPPMLDTTSASRAVPSAGKPAVVAKEHFYYISAHGQLAGEMTDPWRAARPRAPRHWSQLHQPPPPPPPALPAPLFDAAVGESAGYGEAQRGAADGRAIATARAPPAPPCVRHALDPCRRTGVYGQVAKEPMPLLVADGDAESRDAATNAKVAGVARGWSPKAASVFPLRLKECDARDFYEVMI